MCLAPRTNQGRCLFIDNGSIIMNIDTLVVKLNSLSMADFSECEDESAGMKYYNHSDEEVELLCCGLLITAGGRCNWSNIRQLREHGFDVYAGEQDSFGWLTGCIEYPDHERVVVYG